MKPNPTLKINIETNLEHQQILYLQSSANYTYVHTCDKAFISSRTLKVLEERMNNNTFIRINRGLLVNSLYIKLVNKNKADPFVELTSGKRFTISRRKLFEI